MYMLDIFLKLTLHNDKNAFSEHTLFGGEKRYNSVYITAVTMNFALKSKEQYQLSNLIN